jgi:hypothetical protein
MMYGIHVNSDGEIVKLQRNRFDPTPGLTGFKVDDQYLDLIDEIYLGTKKRGRYRVDLTSATLKIVSLDEFIADPARGKFQKVIFADHTYSYNDGFILEIFTKNNRPCLSLTYYGMESLLQHAEYKKLKFYATAENDITVLYEEFIFDSTTVLEEGTQILPIHSINMEKLLNWKFSIFTRKIVSNCVCKFEWPHPSHIRIKE